MAEQCEFETSASFGHRAVVRRDLAGVPRVAWWGTGRPLPGAKGRGGAAILELDGVRGVARDFQRGGALAFVCRRLYFDAARPETELRVLAALDAAGVPVVRPLAALARRCLLVGHRLRLVTELVPDAVPLPAFVAAHPGRRAAAAREAGRVVALAFAAGLEHRDLHPDNLIARPAGAGVEVRLLDLDRAVLRPELEAHQRDRMLLRMARYLVKHAAGLAARPTRTDTLRFLAGHGLDRAARRAAMGRLVPRHAAELRRHGLA